MSGPFIKKLLAGGAVLLSAGALVAGETTQSGHERTTYVSAVSVAQWLKDREGFLLLDVRSAARYAEFHLPRAIHFQRDSLIASVDTNQTVVVYGDEERGAWRAKRKLEGFGYRNVLILEGGVRAWLVDVMSPTISVEASDAERTAFNEIAVLSRYFGGLPRVVPVGFEDDGASAATLLQRTRRKGCAF